MARHATDFIRAMSRATSSVSIVTTNGHSGRYGIADNFAGRGNQPYCYDAGAWEFDDTDLPKLRSATAHFECRTVETVSAGTHTIFIGRVLYSSAGQQTPLLYGNRSYGRQRSLQ
jgi:flavin reductase (DIM6/NTAB) family NADH-FMN oxidoreductase RutF